MLIVDDEPLICMALRSVLKDAGFAVEQSLDGRVALEPDSGSRWDLLITDFRLPSCDGFDVIRSLRRLQPGLPVVMISSYADSVPRETVEELSIDCLIPKPFDLDQIVACAKHLTRSDAQRVYCPW